MASSMNGSSRTGFVRATQANATVAVVDKNAGHAVVVGVQQKRLSMLTESGNYYRTEIEEFEIAVLDIRSLQEKEEKAVLAIEDGSASRDCRDTCCNLLHASRINGRKGIASVIDKESLRKAAKFGKEKIKETIFPLYSKKSREVNSYFTLLLAVYVALKNTTNFATKAERTTADYVNIITAGVSLFFAFIDSIAVTYLQLSDMVSFEIYIKDVKIAGVVLKLKRFQKIQQKTQQKIQRRHILIILFIRLKKVVVIAVVRLLTNT